MKRYKFIFIVLVYKNTEDLRDFFKSIHSSENHVIVVNSFYDKKSQEEFENIAKENNADFLNVENKGYGSGNNAGIEYAINHYKFDFLVVSNADISIENIDENLESENIIAPKIVTKDGKNQNPHTPYYFRWLDNLKYLGFSNNNKKIVYLSIAVNKLFRLFFLLCSKLGFASSIYAAHGAFIIIPEVVIKKLHPIFDENMFLFVEEDVLGYKARQNNIQIKYMPSILIKHKEDGSVSEISDKVYDYIRKSYLHYYKTYVHNVRH